MKQVSRLFLPMTALLTTFAQAEDNTNKYQITAQSLGQALVEYSRQSNTTVFAPDALVEGKLAPSVQGNMTSIEALAQLLSGSGLIYQGTPDSGFTISAAKGIAQPNVTEQEKSRSISIDTIKQKQIEDIVVTAQRREQSIQDVSMSITTAQPDEFVSNGIDDLKELIDYVPGFTTVDFASEGRSSGTLMARGVYQSTYASPVVAVYLDDIPMSANTPGVGATDFFDGILADIERIEFLKGPQGTLYGANALGGSIRYITRKPSLDGVRGSLSTDISTTSGALGQMYIGRLSAPLIENSLGFSLTGFYEKKDGFLNSVDVATNEILDENINANASRGVMGDVLFKISDRFDFRGKAFHQDSLNEGRTQLNIDSMTGRSVFTNRGIARPRANEHRKYTVFAGTFDYDFDWANLTFTTSYTKSAIVSTADLVAGLGGLVDTLEGNPLGTTTSVPVFADIGFERYTQEFRLVSESSEELEWLFGLYHTDNTSFTISSYDGLPTDFVLLRTNQEVFGEEYAVYGSATYYITPDFDFTAGIRYSNHEVGIDRVEPEDGLGPAFNAHLRFPDSNEITWELSLRYRPTTNHSFYTRIATGFRPSLPLFTSANPLTGEVFDDAVDPDNLITYEIGAKGELIADVASYEVAFFYTDWNDFVDRMEIIPGIFSRVTNARGGVATKGIEANFVINPLEGLSIVSTLAWTDSTLKKDEPGFPAVAETPVPLVPVWSASLRSNYEFLLSTQNDLYAQMGFGVRYRSSVNSTFVTTNNYESDDYTLVDANAGISRGNITLNLYVANLFNSNALSYIARGPVASLIPADAIATPVWPRTIGMNIKLDF